MSPAVICTPPAMDSHLPAPALPRIAAAEESARGAWRRRAEAPVRADGAEEQDAERWDGMG